MQIKVEDLSLPEFDSVKSHTYIQMILNSHETAALIELLMAFRSTNERVVTDMTETVRFDEGAGAVTVQLTRAK